MQKISEYITHFLSTTAGKISRGEIPGTAKLTDRFIKKFGIDLSDADIPSGGYQTIHQVFTRALLPGSRKVDRSKHVIVSPADGVISEIGTLQADMKVNVKGTYHSLSGLIQDDELAKSFYGKHYLIIHLRPVDYHRVHYPFSGSIISSNYIKGSLFPVNRWGQKWIKNLYGVNERLVTHVKTEWGQSVVIQVGALMVGGIKATYPILSKKDWESRPKFTFKKADEMGWFEFGSTVFMMIDGPSPQLFPDLRVGSDVRVGKSLWKLQLDD